MCGFIAKPTIGIFLVLFVFDTVHANETVPDEPVIDDLLLRCNTELPHTEPVTRIPAPPVITSEQELSVREYSEYISRIESESGVYAYALVPYLIGLGIAHSNDDNPAAAATAFSQALQITRVNTGLYSPLQLPLLERLTEINESLGRWDALVGNYALMDFLLKKNYPEDHPQLLPYLKKIYYWHMNAYNKDTGQTLSFHYRNAGEAYTQAVEIIEQCTGDKRRALCFWERACCDDALPEYGVCPVDP